MSIKHATFTLERTYPASPARVFAAWSDQSAKARWLAGPGSEFELDFRVGGQETIRGRHGDGPLLTFFSTFDDIVPEQRIVYTSTLSAEKTLTTVSITTVEFVAEGEGTKLVLAQQGTYLDGHEEPSWREEGTSSQLDALAAEFS
ncbi:MAG TPA: SRPBCC family protein [Pseudonocardiaceae bacterium]|nr:SRPBCC family protein [Pseudonocardiaceae bacterium]